MIKYSIDDNYYLRQVTIHDVDDLFEFSSLDVVTDHLTWNSQKSIDETLFAINNFYLTKEQLGIPNSFVIVDSNINKVIGLIDYSKVENEISVGYFLNPKYWGKGIMTNALDKLLDIGFNVYNFNEVYITHNKMNLGSRKVILNNNFKYLKEETVFVQQKNENRETMKYIITKDDYNGNK